jgi:hypothetical protein
MCSWLKETWRWLAGGFAAGLLVVLVALGVRRWRLGRVRVGEEQALERAMRTLESHQRVRERLALEVDEKDAAVARVDDAIRHWKREIIDLHEGGDQVPDRDLERAFAELGY